MCYVRKPNIDLLNARPGHEPVACEFRPWPRPAPNLAAPTPRFDLGKLQEPEAKSAVIDRIAASPLPPWQ
eukprot:65491-Lingulodinium_polyedra.AAC.1